MSAEGAGTSSGASAATKPNLAAIATILNPTVLPDGTVLAPQILSFHNNDVANLVLEQKKPDDLEVTGKVDYTTTKPTPDGNIANPSSITAVINNGLVNVYGIEKDTNELIRLSPVTESVNSPALISQSKINALAGAFSNQGESWLYYTTADDEEDATSFSVTEWKLGTGTTKFPASAVDQASYLAASGFYDSKGKFQRFVVYQTKATGKKTTISITVTGGVGVSTLDHTESAKKQTPLAANWIPSPVSGSLGYLVVYFVDKENNLCRVFKGVNEESWSPVETFDEWADVEDFSQISVVAVPEKKANILTWVVKSQAGKTPSYQQQADRWDTFKA